MMPADIFPVFCPPHTQHSVDKLREFIERFERQHVKPLTTKEQAKLAALQSVTERELEDRRH